MAENILKVYGQMLKKDKQQGMAGIVAAPKQASIIPQYKNTLQACAGTAYSPCMKLNIAAEADATRKDKRFCFS